MVSNTKYLLIIYLRLRRLEIPEGKKVEFKKVLLINDNNNTEVGSPTINGAIVEGLILENLKSKKVIVFKKEEGKIQKEVWSQTTII